MEPVEPFDQLFRGDGPAQQPGITFGPIELLEAVRRVLIIAGERLVGIIGNALY